MPVLIVISILKKSVMFATSMPSFKFNKNDAKYKNNAKNCIEVFNFAKYVTAIKSEILFLEAKSRRADTQNSLAKIIRDMRPTYGSCKYNVIANKQKSNKILSAIGSRIAPKSLVNPYLRASQPSK